MEDCPSRGLVRFYVYVNDADVNGDADAGVVDAVEVSELDVDGSMIGRDP